MPSVDKSLELHCFENCLTELVLADVQLNIWGREIHATAFLCCHAKEQHLPPLSYSGNNVAYYPEHTPASSCTEEFFCFLFTTLSSHVPREPEKDL